MCVLVRVTYRQRQRDRKAGRKKEVRLQERTIRMVSRLYIFVHLMYISLTWTDRNTIKEF